MRADDKRFQMGWTALALMVGVAILVGWISSWDMNITVSVFFIGLGLILGGLGFGVGPKNNYLMIFAGVLGLVGVIAILLRPPGPAFPVAPFLGGIIVAAALAYMVYTYTQK
ncbi:putative membrane protein required for colicin V production [Methanocalculus alkaliphilus]|uniref:hypothetical protein n=1 Tax=Methanocalculus alkaliphilus TaxID=768730 RepID=UPI00209EF879|nr:hypothetical protein [Methanocalculus alkaliphilus]MCP1715828.1 putative membrane protein required for colicin V production [Methanocalculus alkaliphilus]